MYKLPVKVNQLGVLNLFLTLIILFGFAIGSWIFFRKPNFFFQYQKPQPTQTANQSPIQTKPVADKTVDKKDPKWLEKYCKEELVKIPDAPFKYKDKEGIVGTLGDPLILDKFPKDKKYKGKSCVIDYNYEEREAYASVGVAYKFDIRFRNQFEEAVDKLITSKMDSSWKKISPVSNKEGGRPFYSYKGFPMVFTRENPAKGTVDYVDFNWGAKSLFATFSTYEK
ncbi:hypothetical protein HYW46_00065 [Candidatus Daviesbacteria bacterium]|nr:hypothetical protein [Candidatus Daviesbacteria bacterium]